MIRFRVLFPWLVGLLIVVAARGAIWSAIDVQNDLRLARRPSVFQQGMKRREATRISSDQWTEFQINQGSRRVRVMTNAVVSRTDAVVEDEILRPLEDPRSGWRYGVDYELLDLAKRPLERSTYHFRSQTDQWVDPETGEYHFAISLDQPGVAVAQTKVMQFTPQATNHPCYLRLRLGRRDAAVESVYVRVFDQVERPEHDREKTWARMSTRQRERLCANSVFGSELLSIDERNELLRLMWMPSVKHNHFETETLFFLDDSHEMQGSNSQHQQSDAGPEIAGVVVDPQQSVSYCVPREPGNLQIVTSMVIDASSSIDALKHGGVTIQYQCGVSADGLSRDSVSDVGGVVNFPVCGGLLTLKSDSSARALVSWMPSELSESSAAVPIELEPQLGRSRVYLVDDQSLVFDVHTAADQATPCKLVLRIPNDAIFDVEDQQGGVSVFEDALARQKDQGSDVTVRCELFNGFGRVVQTYQIDCSPSHATLDRLDLFGRAGAVSLPTIRYFQLSSDIKTIQLSANGRRVLASVCNRPGQLEHVVRLGANVEIDDVPDLSDDETSDRQNVPQWFPVRPRDYDELISRNRSFLVESHRRPIDRDADILAGRYQWYRFEPIGGWIGNDAMIRQTHTESVDENLRRVREAEQSGRGAMSTYWKLARNRDWDFEGYADQNVKIAAGASLVVDSDRPVGRVTIRVDGEVWQTCELSSRRGEIEFERQLPRRGRIRIESERHASFFLRGCIVPQADMFRRRLLQSFSAGARAIEIDYDKLTDEDELVSIKYFRPWASSIGTDGVSRLCVSVRSDGEAVDAQSVSIRPMKGWTIRQRIYEINSPMAGDSVVLDSGTPLCQGATCFFPLKSDLPTGKYRLVIEPLENASHGFVMVSQSIAGESPQRYLHSK